jgi:hypothetical protein
MTDAPPPPFEVQKWTHEMKRDDVQRAFDLLNSRFDKINEAAIKAADSALRAGLLINGGAAVSVLAFIGSLATKDLIAVSQLSRVAGSLEIFAFGVAAAVVGMGLSYLTHLFETGCLGSLRWIPNTASTEAGLRTKQRLWLRHSAHVLAVIAFFVCIGCFIYGMLSMRDAIQQLAH